MTKQFEETLSLQDIAHAPVIVLAKRSDLSHPRSDEGQTFTVLTSLAGKVGPNSVITVLDADTELRKTMKDQAAHGTKGMPSPIIQRYASSMSPTDFLQAGPRILFLTHVAGLPQTFQFFSESAYERADKEKEVRALLNPGAVSPKNSLLGVWRYEGCQIKNASVEGTLTFNADHTLAIQAEVQSDTPSRSATGKFTYNGENGKLTWNPARSGQGLLPLAPYFLIEGDFLYLANAPMRTAESHWEGPVQITNWLYKLRREP